MNVYQHFRIVEEVATGERALERVELLTRIFEAVAKELPVFVRQEVKAYTTPKFSGGLRHNIAASYTIGLPTEEHPAGFYKIPKHTEDWEVTKFGQSKDA